MRKTRRTKLIVIIILVLLLAGASAYAYSARQNSSGPETVTVRRATLVQSAQISGKVKPAQSVELAFEKGGRVGAVEAQVGDNVREGDSLVRLESSELTAQLSEARARLENARAERTQFQAALEFQQAKLAELKKGTRPEEIAVQQVRVANAETARTEARKGLIDAITDAYTKADDAIRNRVDQFFGNPRSSTPQVLFPVNSQLENDLENGRTAVEATLISWERLFVDLNSSGDSSASLALSKKNLAAVKSFLDLTAFAVNSIQPSASLTQATIDAWKASVSTGRSNINTATAGISAAEEKLSDAASDLSLEEQQLALKKAGTVVEQITAQEAQVRQAVANISAKEAGIHQAEASIKTIDAQLAKAVLRAPLSGVVTKQDAEVGEIVALNEPLVSLISEARFEIESHIPETDIAKVSLGNKAGVALDAYGSDVSFEAVVVSIDPAETIIEGVVTYRTTLQFLADDSRIRPGMTATIHLITQERTGVLAIPQRALFIRDGTKMVTVVLGETTQDVAIQTGVRGSDGTIEIISELKEGDLLAIPGSEK